MTLFISDVSLYQEYLQERQDDLSPPVPDIWTGKLNDHTGLSQGYRQWIELNSELGLQIDEYMLSEDLVIETLPCDFTALVELSFSISGNNRKESIAEGHNFFEAYVEGAANSSYFYWPSGERVLKFDIHMEFGFFSALIGEQMDRLPSELIKTLQATDERVFKTIEATTPLMRMVIDQILNYPYQGMIQKIYLEAKTRELLALRLEQIIGAEPDNITRLRPDQIEQIHQARDIIEKHLDNPPSLTALAHQVGLNDCTLKRGFRQVFGKTVFGCLLDYRMAQAYQLLQEHRLNVEEVARKVGYANRRSFATAFRKKFGQNPKEIQRRIS